MRSTMIKIIFGGLLALFMVGMFLSNSFDAQASNLMDLPPRPTPISRQANNSPPEVSLTIRANRNAARVGDTVEFTITLVNLDRTTGRGLRMVGLLPEIYDVEKLATTHGLIGLNPETGRVKVYNIGPLHPNTKVVITIMTRVNKLAVDGDKYYTAAKVELGSGPGKVGLFSNWLRLDIGSK